MNDHLYTQRNVRHCNKLEQDIAQLLSEFTATTEARVDAVYLTILTTLPDGAPRYGVEVRIVQGAVETTRSHE